jgi:hypothetical protein
MAKKKPETNGQVNCQAVADPPLEPLRPEPPPAPRREPDQEEPRRPPVHTIRYANIQGCVYEVARPDGSVWYNCTFMRLYRTTDHQGREIEAASYTYGLRDMAYLEKTVAACFEWVNGQYATDTPF